MGTIDVTGIASDDAVSVEVRLKGFTDGWETATLISNTWHISLTVPMLERDWWVEARAIDANNHYQAPYARHRIRMVVPPMPQTAWADICVPHRMEVTGAGMGDKDMAVNPQTLALANPANVNSLLVQVSGRDDTPPDSVTFTTDGIQMAEVEGTSSETQYGYVVEVYPLPTAQVTATVNHPGDGTTPRGLVFYAKRTITGSWTSVGKTTNTFVYRGHTVKRYTETLTFPPLPRATDLDGHSRRH